MKRSIGWLVAVLLVALGLPHQALGLGVGDKAPPLRVTEWVQGKEVQFPGDFGKKVYLVKFWATWCPPCSASIPILTEYQKKYSGDLEIVAVTDPDDRGNTPTAVRRFVKRKGEEMIYTVAIDDKGGTSKAYMAAAGAMGIPHSFLIGRDGTIVWQGSPLDPVLGEIIPKVISGSYDVSNAQLEEEINRRLRALSFPIQLEQWGTVWDGLAEILKLDPGNEVALDALTSIYSRELRNTRTFREWASAHIDANKDNVAAMERLAGSLLAIQDFSTRVPDIALKAAKAAYEASDRSRASAITIYAQAMYQIGHLDRAIELQKSAVASATDQERRDVERTLGYYEMCKQLQGSVN
jgi:thiol-disulfide isomerase/thioredoxin